MKKYIKVRKNMNGEIIEIIIKDFSGRNIDKYKFNGSDGLFYGRVIETLHDKFGLKPIINNKSCITVRDVPEKNFFNY